jgi:inhibitor of cysteine peptidase
MKHVISLISVAAILTAAAVLQAADAPAAPAKKAPKPMQLTDADNGKTVAVAVGKPFDVVLKGNASTGFQWKVAKIDGDAVEKLGKADYLLDPNPKRMVGVGGRYVLHFKAAKAAKTKIHLVYVRPWEKDTPPANTFEAVIDSTPSSTTAADDTLTFEGTVASIEASPIPQSEQNFVVTMQVDRVVKGEFKGKTFQFRIHSPALSGLKAGQKCVVEAKRTADGYTVDQNQWLGNPTKPKNSP